MTTTKVERFNQIILAVLARPVKLISIGLGDTRQRYMMIVKLTSQLSWQKVTPTVELQRSQLFLSCGITVALH